MVESAPQPIVLSSIYRLIEDPGLRWESLQPGIEIHRLYRWPSGQSAALLRYAPGASLATHRHVAFEHILVLAGSQSDENGLHQAGAMLIHPPGTRHTVTSRTGCVVLAIWEQAVIFDSI